MEIEPFDVNEVSDDDLARLHRVVVEYYAEILPDDPPSPFERYAARVRYRWPWSETRRWVARDGDRIVGEGVLSVSRNRPENQHLAWGDVTVAADHRGQGLGRALAGPVIDAAEEDGRTVLAFGAERDHPSVGFCRRLAGEPRITERISRLLLDEVDRVLVDEWIKKAPDRAEGYELGGFDGACPPEHVEAFAKAIAVMNTAPREDFEIEDEQTTPEMVEEWAKSNPALGITPWVRWAIHGETGEIAGYTETMHDRWKPWEVNQGDTGVWPQHRERGLGRWLKADMLARVLDECPDARWIDTGNAGSNRAMLAINDTLGFRPILWWQAWQAEIGQVRSALG